MKKGPFKMKSSLDKLLNKTDMSKLRSKQARSRKGISEFEYFADPNTQGDEPGVEGTYGGGTQTTDFSGKKKGKGKTQEERAKSLKNKK